jgi:hypothetical protein
MDVRFDLLRASQVKQQGHYWYRKNKEAPWRMLYCHSRYTFSEGPMGPLLMFDAGEFIGPIQPPEI